MLGHHAHTSLGQAPVGQPLQLGRADGGELAAEGDQDLAPGEGRGVGREPFGTCQLIEHPPDGHAVRGDVALAADHLADQPLGVDAALRGLGLPAAVQGLGGLVGLGWPGGMRHELDEPGGARLALLAFQALQLGADLLVPLGEGAHQFLGHPDDRAVAPAVRLAPLDAERAGQLVPIGGPVDRVGGLAVGEQVPAVEGAPASVGPLGAVDDDQVGVGQRGPRPG